MVYALLFLAAALAGCDGPTALDAPDPCSLISESSCIESTACTLTQTAPSGPYSCRAAADGCEEGFRQGLDTQDSCEQDTACSFIPGSCYCPPGVDCVCGGGPPPQCRLN